MSSSLPLRKHKHLTMLSSLPQDDDIVKCLYFFGGNDDDIVKCLYFLSGNDDDIVKCLYFLSEKYDWVKPDNEITTLPS
jgi:hypothetical protein